MQALPPESAPCDRQSTPCMREVFERARASIFESIGDLGGPPSEQELAASKERVRRVNVWAGEAMATLLDEFAPGFDLFADLKADDRESWRRRAPGLVGLGINTYRQLMRFSEERCDARYALAAGLFQLLTGYLDWLGNETPHGSALAAGLPPGTIHSLSQQPRFRTQYLADLRRHAVPEVGAFSALLGALYGLLERLPGESIALRYLIAQVVTMQTEAICPINPELDGNTVAQTRAGLPTLVIGELARQTACAATRGTVWDAATKHSPVFGFLSELRSLPRDLDSGRPNALGGVSLTSAGAPATLEAWLAADHLGMRTSEVVDALRRIDQLLGAMPQGRARREATLSWLRILMWDRLQDSPPLSRRAVPAG
ncbi:MAG: hypothetical protein JNM79_12355 [Burkholderiales bacterium]|nr:hypothetical protein [Burkholderiales bacterium]